MLAEPLCLSGMTDSQCFQVIAAAGIVSRRAAERLIFQGAVTVNGKKVLVPQTAVDPVVDQVGRISAAGPGPFAALTWKVMGSPVCP